MSAEAVQQVAELLEETGEPETTANPKYSGGWYPGGK
jgi:hypothetical protein